MFGSAMALSTIPAYGLDQLIDKPNSSVRSFVHWLTWCLFVGFGISYIHFVKRSSQLPNLLLTTTIVVLIVNSFALVLHGFFNHKFEFSGTLKTNPYKMVYKVVKYAKDHKYPVARSSLTYWEDVPLSRIDFGKAKYGGPFTEDQVEDVKSFGRITFILVSMFGFFIPYYAGFLGVFDFINSFDGAITELYGYASFIPWYLSEQTILIIIPIMEIVIIPLFPKIEYFLSHPLIGIIAMYVLLLISLICLVLITTIGHVISPTHVPCLVVSPTKTVQLSFAYLVVPIFLAGITSGPRFMFMFEFILSQSPSNFSGMLIGAYWLIQAVYINIGSLIQVPFSLGRLDGPGNMPCTFWVLLINIMICFIGMIIFITAAKKYKARQRGDNYNYRAVIESTYERRYQNMLKDESADFETDYEFDIVDDYDPNISQSST
jgi:peptide/histidine transporter 3/4